MAESEKLIRIDRDNSQQVVLQECGGVRAIMGLLGNRAGDSKEAVGQVRNLRLDPVILDA